MKNYFDAQFEMRYFEMNKLGFASPTTILTLLEETAAEHCGSINYNLYDLEKRGIGWVLLSGFMKMDRYPVYKEKITIRTWLSSCSSIKGFRENLIFDENGNIIGRAKGLWVFFDINRRRPVRIYDDILEQWGLNEEQSIHHDISNKIEPIDSADFIQEFEIKRFDTDMYKHVNNIRYLQWAFESIPEEIADNYFLHSIDGRFVAEAQFGDIIESLAKPDTEPNSFLHTIKVKETNKVCAVARTTWKRIGE